MVSFLGNGVWISIDKAKFELNRKDWSLTFQEYVKTSVGGRFPWEQKQKVEKYAAATKQCTTVDELIEKGIAKKMQLKDSKYSYLGNSLAFGTS
jgi:hypothetical protein